MNKVPESVATLNAIERRTRERLHQLDAVHIWCALENRIEAERSILRCNAVLAIIEAAKANPSFPSADLLSAMCAEIEAMSARPVSPH